MTTETCKPPNQSKAYGMTQRQLDAWQTDVVTKRIPEPYRTLKAVTFTTDAHGTIWAGYVLAESSDAIAFVRGWLIGRESFA